MSSRELILCHDCDLLNRVAELPSGASALCPRCGGLLDRHIPNSIDRTLALVLAGLVLFLVANAFPFLAMKMQGQVTDTTLASGVRALYAHDERFVGSLVLFTTIVAPLLQLLLLLSVLAPLRFGRRVPGMIPMFRLLRRVESWSMMEVFLIGILVSLVKLADMAQIVPGIAIWSFALLIPVLVAAKASLDPHLVCERIGRGA